MDEFFNSPNEIDSLNSANIGIDVDAKNLNDETADQTQSAQSFQQIQADSEPENFESNNSENIENNEPAPQDFNNDEVKSDEELIGKDIGKNFNKAFAIAWNQNQGDYKKKKKKKIINFAKLQSIKIDSALDICCGSANFLKYLSNYGIDCTGTEIMDSYIEYDKEKYKNIKFIRCDSILDIDNLGKFDLITCNHDVINMLPTLKDWSTLFKKVYAHLNNGGLFIFDYYTKRKLRGWNEVTYDENEKLDYIRSVTSSENKTTITNIYYINLDPQLSQQKNLAEKKYSLSYQNIRYKRTENSEVEYYFENDDILNEIKHSGYRYLITTDSNLKPISSLSDQNRMHLIAIKREKS